MVESFSLFCLWSSSITPLTSFFHFSSFAEKKIRFFTVWTLDFRTKHQKIDFFLLSEHRTSGMRYQKSGFLCLNTKFLVWIPKNRFLMPRHQISSVRYQTWSFKKPHTCKNMYRKVLRVIKLEFTKMYNFWPKEIIETY